MRLFEIIRNPNKLPPSVPSQEHLYHGTQMYYLALIIATNRLDQGAHWHKPGEPHGVRCTRSMGAAKSFAFDQEIPGGIVVLNWPNLAKHYKTIPYADTQYNDVDPTQPGEAWNTDEAEEVILTAAVKPLAGFLEGILMQSEDLKKLRAGEFLKDEWIESFMVWASRTPAAWQKAVRALMAYPNIKAIG